MIIFKNVTKNYINNNKVKKALSDVSLELPEKGLVHLSGKSGSGKSTLLNIIGTIANVTSGEIEYTSIHDSNISNTTLRNQYIGFIYQNFHLIDSLTVYDNIKLSLEVSGDENPDEAFIYNQMQKLDILELKDRLPSEISGGEKQRVAICRILVKGCKVILADEPTGNLDEENARSVLQLLKNLSKNILIVVASHDNTLMSAYTNNKIVLSEGMVKEVNLSDDYEKDEVITSIDNVKASSFRILNRVKRVLSFEKNKKRLALTLLIMITCLFSIGMMLNLKLLDASIIQDNIYSSRSVEELQILLSDEYDETNLLNNFDNYSFNHVVTLLNESYASIMNLSMDVNYEDSILKMQVDSITVAENIELDGNNFNLNEGEIVITDYLLDGILYYTNWEVSNDGNYIGSSINIYGHNVIVKGILNTKYKENSNSFESVNDYIKKYNYNTIYMNQQTYDQVKFPTDKNIINIDTQSFEIRNISTLKQSYTDDIIGDIPESKGEIVVSTMFLHIFDIDFDNAIGQEVYLKLSDLDNKKNIKENFKIVGLFRDNGNEVVIIEDDYNYLSQGIGQSLDDVYMRSLKASLNADDNSKLFSYIKSKNLSVMSECNEDVSWALIFLEHIEGISSALVASGLILSTLFMYLLLSMNVESNKKNIGILLSLGSKKMDIVKMVLMNNIKIVVLSTGISYICLIIINRMLNNYIFSQVEIESVLYTNIWVIFLMLFVGVVILIVSAITPLNKFYKQEISKLTA